MQWRLLVGGQIGRHGQFQIGACQRKIRPVVLFSVKDFPDRQGPSTRQNDSFGLVPYTHLCFV